jgi:hypothetical protein
LQRRGEILSAAGSLKPSRILLALHAEGPDRLGGGGGNLHGCVLRCGGTRGFRAAPCWRGMGFARGVPDPGQRPHAGARKAGPARRSPDYRFPKPADRRYLDHGAFHEQAVSG